MRQFYRYIMQIRGQNFIVGKAEHWLWWALMLAQLFTLTVFNRIEAIEADHIKRAMPDLVSILPAVLLEALKHKLTKGLLCIKILIIVCI